MVFKREINAQDPSELGENILIFRYISSEESSVLLKVEYDYRIEDEFDVQSKIYFVD